MVDSTYSVLTRAFRLTGSLEIHSIYNQMRLSCCLGHYILTRICCCAIITRPASRTLALVSLSAVQGCNPVLSPFVSVIDTVGKPMLFASS